MMRTSALGGLVMLLGCSRPNPHFGEPTESTGGDADGSGAQTRTSTDGGPTVTTEVGTGGTSADETVTDTDPTDTTGTPDAWWDPEWSRRRPIHLDLQTVAPREDLESFPVLVTFDPMDLTGAAADGADLRFIGPDGELLDHEIEGFGSPASFVWVRVPLLPARASEEWIYMYYGNPEATTADNPVGLWTQGGHVAVYHFVDDQSIDSTGNATGTPMVNPQTFSMAPVGEGISFPDDGSWVELPAAPELQGLFAGGGTISVWIRPLSWGGGQQGRIIDKSDDMFSNGGWIFNVDAFSLANQPQLETLRLARGQAGVGDGYIWEMPSGTIELGQWQHVVVTYDEEQAPPPAFYVDGVRQPTMSKVGKVADLSLESSGPLRVASAPEAVEPRNFDGAMDELRLATTLRSDAWVELQHRSMTGDMATLQQEQTVP